MLNELPTISNSEESEEMHGIQRKEKVWQVVMGLNRSSTEELNGMIGSFYQDTQNIIGDDMYRMVKTFFYGTDLQVCNSYRCSSTFKEGDGEQFSDLRLP